MFVPNCTKKCQRNSLWNILVLVLTSFLSSGTIWTFLFIPTTESWTHIFIKEWFHNIFFLHWRRQNCLWVWLRLYSQSLFTANILDSAGLFFFIICSQKLLTTKGFNKKKNWSKKEPNLDWYKQTKTALSERQQKLSVTSSLPSMSLIHIPLKTHPDWKSWPSQ